MRIGNPVIVTLAVGLMILGLTSVSPAQSDSNSDERTKRLFQRAPEADADKDGVLTRKEVQAFLDARRNKQPIRNREPPKPTHEDVKYGEHERHATCRACNTSPLSSCSEIVI
jgi:hypothetical protein